MAGCKMRSKESLLAWQKLYIEGSGSFECRRGDVASLVMLFRDPVIILP
jgi:hypothetical protein